MPVLNNVLAGAAGQAGGAAADYNIERSLRFNGSTDSAHLDRTPTASNRRVWTWSGWVKKSSLTGNTTFFSAGSDGSNRSHFMFDGTTHALRFFDLPESVGIITNALFRDPSAWYHLVLAVNTTLNTTADRVKIYVNGEQLTSFSSSNYPGYNAQLQVNANVEHRIGSGIAYGEYFHGYIADVNFVDGQQLDASEFGQTNTTTGVWNPKEFSGTYGTNGYHLDFSNNSSDAALGTDSSGNNHTWTVNNLSSGAAVANKGFDVVTYTGNGTSQTIPLNFEPGLIWTKGRNNTEWHVLVDKLRPTSKFLYANENLTESGNQSQGVTATSSTGYTIGSSDYLNKNTYTYVSWCWKAGGAATTLNTGSISASVSANTDYGFSIVKYTGDGTTNGSVAHGLGSTPKFVIVKKLGSGDWKVRHTSLGATEMASLNEDYLANTASWNGETSSVFYPARVGDTYLNANTDEYIAYCWSEIPGFSKFGKWTGNGSSSGPTITLGFKPRWVLFKRTDQSGDNWTIFDTARDSGTLNFGLQPNNNLEEQNFGNREILVSDTGFQVTSTGSSSNATGGTYIYAAFADGSSNDIDSLLDSPSNYEANSGNNGGNYCTWNPLATFTGVQGISNARVYSQGNLKVNFASGSSWAPGCGTISVNSGKWYAEFEMADATGSNHFHVGINPPLNHFTGVTYHSASNTGHWYGSNGQMWNAGSAGSVGAVATANNGDIIGIALDFDASTVTFYKNGSSLTSVSLNSNITTYGAVFGFDIYPGCSCIANFGQRPFKYTVPTGHLSLCSQNLTAPFDNPKTAFEVKKYTGNGSTQTVSLSHSPDWVWVKGINQGNDHEIASTVGLAANRGLATNLSARDFVTVIEPGTNGFYLDGISDYANTNNINYISWNWDAGTTTSTNANGTINNAQVRANVQAGCSLISYTGNQTSGATVGHGLSKAPSFWIMKAIDSGDMWVVRHASVPNTHYMQLDDPAQARNAVSDVTGDADSTATVIPIGAADANNNGTSYVAFCLAEIPGFSSIGMYEGAGPERFVHCGFKPAFVLYKNFDASAGWQIYDSTRSPFNVCDERLQANSAGNEDTTVGIDILSNGFITKSTHTRTNTSGNTYLYVAMAESPFKYSRAR